MVAPLAAMAGGTILTRAAAWFGTSKYGQTISQVLYNPFVQAGQFGIGYTGGAYLGYGASNTWDPLGLHKPKYRYTQANIMPYGSYGRRRYSPYRRYSGYTRYRRYRRRRPYYRRRSYY
jgi:hypothetical protein